LNKARIKSPPSAGNQTMIERILFLITSVLVLSEARPLGRATYEISKALPHGRASDNTPN
jgi:hypothetical protein